MTERYQGWSLPALRSDNHESDAIQNRSLEQPVVHYSGFTSINSQQQRTTSTLNIGDVGNVPTSDPDVNISHAAKHPIVAQYLGIGLDDAYSSPFGRQPMMPPSSSKKRPHATLESTPPTHKQGKQTSKKRPASTPLPKPAKKTKKSRSDDGRAIVSGPKTNIKTRAKTSSAVSAESNEHAALFDSERQLEALPGDSFALSDQTAQKLNAWKFQPSLPSSNIDDLNRQPNSNIDHPVDTHLPLNSNVKPVSHGTANGHVAILSPITSLDVIRGSQGYGHSIYNNTSWSHSNQVTTSKTHPEPQPVPLPSRLPPSTGQVLETIFEESPPSSFKHAEELPNIVSESSNAPLPVSTQPSSASALYLGSGFFQDDFFDELDDDDLLDLENPAKSIAPQQASRTSNQSSHFTPSSENRCVDSDVIEILSDDEWNILEDEEVAFMDLTSDMRPARPPLTPIEPSAAKTHGKAAIAMSSVADNNHGKEAQRQLTVSQQGQPSSQLHSSDQNPTAAESTEDYLNTILHPPIIRPPFPKPIRDRSPLIGVSSSLVLKTCFRIGECLNVGCTFARNSNTQSSDTILIELYAKVVSSRRDANDVTQHFVLADLFHEKRGPFLNATCETWKGSELWEYDCGRFLGAEQDAEKKICRAVGRMKREGGKWRFVVLNIWEATWDDVEFVRGIICRT